MVDEEREKEKHSLLPLIFFQIDFNPYILELTVFPRCLKIKSLGVTGIFVLQAVKKQTLVLEAEAINNSYDFFFFF